MAIAKPPAPSKLLTYEEYMAEGETEGSYYIVDGVRVFMSSPIWRHQRIAIRISQTFVAYEEASDAGFTLVAPYDVLIRRRPLRTRQPDVLFISKAQLERGGGIPEKGPLEVAPELVVEIISDSERRSIIEDKIANYCVIGVQECWRVWPDTRTVEVLRLTRDGVEIVAVYDEADTIQSVVFPDLTVAVADIFKE